MIHYTCDVCGAELPRGSLRYVAKIDVFAAYDTLEITREDLRKDIDQELREIFARMEGIDADTLLREVYADFKFDLCARCQRKYVEDPLSGLHGAG